MSETNADGTIEVKDADGRVLVVREMDPADQLDLFEAAGQNSNNNAWVGLALVICSVKSIDGVPEPMPRTPDQIKALARRLKRSGINAAAEAIGRNLPDVDDAAKN